MKKSTLGDDWPPLAPSPRPGHRYQVASIVVPFLGLAVAIGYLCFTPSFGGLNHWPDISRQDHRRMTPAFWMLGIAGVAGLFAAGKSIARKEKPVCLAALGLILNVPPVLLWLLMLAETLIDWAGVV
jgi:hypothetical protein